MLLYNLYRLPSWRVCVGCWYDYLFSYCETSIPMDNIQIENRWMPSLLTRFIYCATLVRTFSFCEAFLHKEATWSSKRKLLLKQTPSSFWFELLLIVSFLTFNIASCIYKQVTSVRVCFKIVVWKPVKNFICILL